LVHDGKVTIIDFDTARKCEDAEALKEEWESLPKELAETTGRGGVTIHVGAS